jgi:catechol 2,3-dioxygenase-like lactoylglutathione lyase family enzyme
MAIPADLDHLVFTCADLDAGIAWAERTFGVRPVRGGAHPQWGTHNVLAGCHLRSIAHASPKHGNLCVDSLRLPYSIGCPL